MTRENDSASTQDGSAADVGLMDDLSSIYEEMAATGPSLDDAADGHEVDAVEDGDEEDLDAADAEGDDEDYDDEEDDEDISDQDATSDSDDDDEDDDVEIPQHFSKKLRNWISTLDAEGQRVAVQRLKEMNDGVERKLNEVAKERQRYQALDSVLEPYREQFALEGVDEAMAVRQLLQAQTLLQTQPVQALKWLAAQSGVDLSKLSEDLAEQEYVDPQIASLQQTVGNLSQTIQQQQQAEQQRRTAELQTMISNFASETDDAGLLKHPYYEEVKQEMGVLMYSGQAADLESAYDKAVWANPTTRAKLIASEEAERRKPRKERIAKANRRKPVKTTKAGAEPAKPMKLEDELSAIYDSLAG